MANLGLSSRGVSNDIQKKHTRARYLSAAKGLAKFKYAIIFIQDVASRDIRCY